MTTKIKQLTIAQIVLLPKKVLSDLGEIELAVPRDREGEFEPKAVKKHQTNVLGIEDKILRMYAQVKAINKAVYIIMAISMSGLKVLYLAAQDVAKKWTQNLRGWSQILAQLLIHFEDRFDESMI